jgi:hypothetical protein
MQETAQKYGTGLVVFISSPGAQNYMFNVAYGTAKAALDRLAKDMAVDLRSVNIASISLWPGMVKTERMLSNAAAFKRKFMVDVEKLGETSEFSGNIIFRICKKYRSSYMCIVNRQEIDEILRKSIKHCRFVRLLQFCGFRWKKTSTDWVVVSWVCIYQFFSTFILQNLVQYCYDRVFSPKPK